MGKGHRRAARVVSRLTELRGVYVSPTFRNNAVGNFSSDPAAPQPPDKKPISPTASDRKPVKKKPAQLSKKRTRVPNPLSAEQLAVVARTRHNEHLCQKVADLFGWRREALSVGLQRLAACMASSADASASSEEHILSELRTRLGIRSTLTDGIAGTEATVLSFFRPLQRAFGDRLSFQRGRRSRKRSAKSPANGKTTGKPKSRKKGRK